MWLLLTLSSFLLISTATQDSDKVREGEECVPHTQPWQVALYEHSRFNCGAPLISPHWVLTAAHCRTRLYSFMKARLGEHNLRKRDGPEQLRVVSHSIPHPHYRRVATAMTSCRSVTVPDTLHCANIRIICQASRSKGYPGHLMDTMGDSGGPLICGGALWGIVSWGDAPCDTTTKAGVYTKVCRYLQWIRDTMKRN